MKRRILLGLALAVIALGQRVGVYLLGTLSAAGTTIPVNVYLAAHKHTVQATVTGAPTTCNIQLEGTLDDITSSAPNWANLSGSQVCTSTLTFSVTERPVTGIRVNLTALSGGTSPTVTIKYVGVQ